jgi:hypothetical protein
MTLLMTLLFAFLIISGTIAAMSVGVMAGRKPIKGSCGGLNGRSCELCSGQCKRRSEQSTESQSDVSEAAQ